jgi:integrase
MRGQGRVFRPKVDGRESQVWWLDYSIRGKRHRESSGTTSKKEAFALLRERIGKRSAGTLTGRPDRVTLADLKKALQTHYLLEGNASWPRALQAFTHLETFFGADARVIAITRSAVSDYQESRLIAEAARNTVRYETGVLSAAFGVAAEKDLLATKPVFSRLGEGEKRSGFFGSADFAALVVELPTDLADVVRFARMTGWRRGEVTGLLWSQVEWDDDQYPGAHSEPEPGANACIRIGEAQTKGGDSRQFPLAGADELRELLLSRWQSRSGLHVFHRNGKPIGDFRKAWARACTAAGVPDRLFHDLRRTAARDFRQAGVSEGEIMRLCGWKTRDMFDRYNIIDDADLNRAVFKRYGKGTANKAIEVEQAV